MNHELLQHGGRRQNVLQRQSLRLDGLARERGQIPMERQMERRVVHLLLHRQADTPREKDRDRERESDLIARD